MSALGSAATRRGAAPGRRPVRRALLAAWRLLDWSRRLALNALFLAVVVAVVGALWRAGGGRVPPRAALVVAPRGQIVEQLAHRPPALLLLGEGIDELPAGETLLAEILESLAAAAEDRRIQAVLLDLSHLEGAGLSKLQEIGRAVLRCRARGKPVLAYADHYGQAQYYLAVHADEVYLHPLGGVALQGFAAYRTYYRTALERLRVTVHAFCVGSYKSALEPVLRDSMSAADAEATSTWLQALWQAYCAEVAAQRGLSPHDLHDYAARLPQHVEAAGGDLGALARARGLVDSLLDRRGLEQRLVELVGAKDDGTFNQIDMEQYHRRACQRAPSGPARAQVGIIVGRGLVMGGTRRHGRIGSDSMARLFARARADSRIRAVVLRLDTGGGSAFASEAIRREVELTRQAGKPVVASFSSVAASGGYWIAAAADQIWASPTTLTGSIGIFAAFPTFVRSLETLGIHTDGVATTRIAGAPDPRRRLDPELETMMQSLVQRGYDRFIEVVAAGRGMPRERVEAAARGRVWAGAAARELGLVDSLGTLADATRAAAALAGLDAYRVTYLDAEPSAAERVARWLAGQGATGDGEELAADWSARLAELRDEVLLWRELDDPHGLYAWCPGCASP